MGIMREVGKICAMLAVVVLLPCLGAAANTNPGGATLHLAEPAYWSHTVQDNSAGAALVAVGAYDAGGAFVNAENATVIINPLGVLKGGDGGPEPVEYEVEILPVLDNTIYSESADLSNGVGQHLFSAKTNQGNLRRALLYFDVEGAIPPDATITGAELVLTENGFVDTAVDVSVHRLLADWGEGTSDAPNQEGMGTQATPGDATWLYGIWDAENPTFWNSPGGDFDAVPLATTTVGGNGQYGWTSAALRNVVRDWYDGVGQNFGLIVVSEEIDDMTAKRFASRENPDTTARPVLVVQYTLEPCEPKDPAYHSADTNKDNRINLVEVLRVVQLFNLLEYSCLCGSEDGYKPRSGPREICTPHSSDYINPDWRIDLVEVLRAVQIFNLLGYSYCPGVGEDDFCPGAITK